MNLKKILFFSILFISAIAVFLLNHNKSSIPKESTLTNGEAGQQTTFIAPEASGQRDPVEMHSQHKHEAHNHKVQITPELEPEIRAALQRMINTSDKGLIEVATDKGVTVNLKNRFRTVPVATILPDGSAVITDYTSAPNKLAQ